MRFRLRVQWINAWAGLALAATTLPLQAAPAGAPKFDARSRAIIDSASSDEAKRAESVRAGRLLAEFCANCHGKDGVSLFPEVPHLASQNTAYTFEQIRRFISGERGDAGNFERQLMKALTDREKAAVVIFFAQLPPAPARVPGPTAERGKAIYQSRCVPCHGEDGHGAELIPRIAGQPSKYIELSINHFRHKDGVRKFAPMTEVLQDVPAEDLPALIDYVSSMR